MGGEVWHSQQTFTVCTANCWGELRVPSRRRHLHLPLWWLSPVCCLFISGVFAQAVNALGLYSWWKWLGASSRSQCCYNVSPLASHMSRLCSVFHMQQSELYICADFSYYKCQNAFIQIALKPNSLTVPCTLLCAVTKNRIFPASREGGFEYLPHLYTEERDSWVKYCVAYKKRELP